MFYKQILLYYRNSRNRSAWYSCLWKVISHHLWLSSPPSFVSSTKWHLSPSCSIPTPISLLTSTKCWWRSRNQAHCPGPHVRERTILQHRPQDNRGHFRDNFSCTAAFSHSAPMRPLLIKAGSPNFSNVHVFMQYRLLYGTCTSYGFLLLSYVVEFCLPTSSSCNSLHRPHIYLTTSFSPEKCYSANYSARHIFFHNFPQLITD